MFTSAFYNRPLTTVTMDTHRIAELLEPFFADAPKLSPHQVDQISIYIDLLLRWNSRVNLTAIRTPDEIVTRHFGESLFAARHLLKCEAVSCGADTPVRKPAAQPPPMGPHKPHAAEPPLRQPTKSNEVQSGTSVVAGRPSAPAPSETVLDVGSGAGFPGLPIKIWSPQTRVTLIESNNKKVAFLREIIRALTLTSIDVFAGRAQNFPANSGTVVTLRAVERFEEILPAAANLVAPAGRLALLIGDSQRLKASTSLPNFHWAPPLPVPLSTARQLAIGELRPHSIEEPGI